MYEVDRTTRCVRGDIENEREQSPKKSPAGKKVLKTMSKLPYRDDAGRPAQNEEQSEDADDGLALEGPPPARFVAREFGEKHAKRDLVARAAQAAWSAWDQWRGGGKQSHTRAACRARRDLVATPSGQHGMSVLVVRGWFESACGARVVRGWYEDGARADVRYRSVGHDERHHSRQRERGKLGRDLRPKPRALNREISARSPGFN